MATLLTTLAIFIVGLFLISLFVKWYTALCYRLIVVKKEDALESVLTTRSVPMAWRRLSLEKLARAIGGHPGRAMQRTLIISYSRRIRPLVAFIKNNPRMDAEQKGYDAETLEEIAREWRECRLLSELL